MAHKVSSLMSPHVQVKLQLTAAAAGAVEEIRLGPTVPPPPLAPPSLLPALLTRGVGDSLQCWLTALSLYWLLSACALLHAPSLIAGELLPACERRGRWHWWRRAAPDCGAHPAQMVSLAYALGAAYLFIAFLLVLMSRSAPRVRLWCVVALLIWSLVLLRSPPISSEDAPRAASFHGSVLALSLATGAAQLLLKG